jgi:N-acetylmuramoyl-L-alanine amidase
MGKQHTVVQGEYLSKIAHEYGFKSYKTIWNAPENKDLKEKRKNPNVLFPGDVLFIPDREVKEVSCVTDRRHKFQAKGEDLELRIALKGFRNEPLQEHECTLVVESDRTEFKTKWDGIIEKKIPETASQGLLLDKGKAGSPFSLQREIVLKIGHLDPVETMSGQIARLNNLGYDAAELPDHTLTVAEEERIRKSVRFLSAVEEFQCDFNLTVDGICGKKTQAKLLESHGC